MGSGVAGHEQLTKAGGGVAGGWVRGAEGGGSSKGPSSRPQERV